VTLLAVGLCVMCQVCLVTGQLMLKRAMNETHGVPPPWATIGWNIAAGIGCLSMWFFLWLGLLRSWELSRLFPFEGLGPPLLVFCAWIFLNERVSPRAWTGIVLIGVGVAFVARD
jgi:undecaprenyl phosphate-alpha-L-ara4N flippase subunit ArnE